MESIKAVLLCSSFFLLVWKSIQYLLQLKMKMSMYRNKTRSIHTVSHTQVRVSGRRLCCCLFLLFPLQLLLFCFSTFLLLQVLLDFLFKFLLLASDFLQLCFPLGFQIWILILQINTTLVRNTKVKSLFLLAVQSLWDLKMFQQENRANLSLQDHLLSFVDLLLLIKVRRLEPLQDGNRLKSLAVQLCEWISDVQVNC